MNETASCRTTSDIDEIEKRLIVLSLLYDSSMEDAEAVCKIISKFKIEEEDERLSHPDVDGRREEAQKMMTASEIFRDSLETEEKAKKKCFLKNRTPNICTCNICEEYSKVVSMSALWCDAAKGLFEGADGLVNIFRDWFTHVTILAGRFDDANSISHLEMLLGRVDGVVNTMKAAKEKHLKDY